VDAGAFGAAGRGAPEPSMTTMTHRLHARRPHSLAIPALIALSLLALVGLGCRSQNGNDAPIGSVNAAFSPSATSGQPGLVVTFTNTSTGDFDTLAWDFGNTETSTDPNPPPVVYDDPGTYAVSLTLTTASGTSTATSEIVVAASPTAGLTCSPDDGIVPVTVSCSSTATNAAETRYEVVETGVLVSGASASFDFTVPGTYTIQQTVDNGIGDQATASTTVDVYDLSIEPSVPSGSPPVSGPITFSAVSSAPDRTVGAWFVDGVIVVALSFSISPVLSEPGTYTIRYEEGGATREIEYVVAFGPPVAAFTISSDDGPEVTFNDASTGTISTRRWDFGDGNSCVFPAPEAPSGDTVCDSPSPTHTYGGIDDYVVTLSITGEGATGADATATSTDVIRVAILDPSFESQGANTNFVANPTSPDAWKALFPIPGSPEAQHLVLAESGGGADAGMPTRGTQWAALDGLGTDGSDPALTIQNGIETAFLRPATRSVLEFDYVMLYSEPPAGTVLDAMTAAVSDGTTTVEIPSARADVTSPYAGGSARFPTLDGATTRATPVRTASLDLATAFPGAPADQVYTLAIRLTNDVNDFRSPRVYVDDVRFVAAANPLSPFTAAFSAPATVVAGEPVDFMDETCDGTGGCLRPTSHRWDFGTHLSPALLSASGSGERDPVYTYVLPGDYTVELLARNADRESLTTMMITVLDAVVSVPAIAPGSGTTAPATIDFVDQSTSDPNDDIVAWSWDFAGWGTSIDQNPMDVLIGQAGTWTIRLTVTTASGQTDTRSLDVVLD